MITFTNKYQEVRLSWLSFDRRDCRLSAITEHYLWILDRQAFLVFFKGMVILSEDHIVSRVFVTLPVLVVASVDVVLILIAAKFYCFNSHPLALISAHLAETLLIHNEKINILHCTAKKLTKNKTTTKASMKTTSTINQIGKTDTPKFITSASPSLRTAGYSLLLLFSSSTLR